MITFLGQEMLSTHISSPRNVIYSHFFAKKRYQPAGSVITFLRREIVRPITDISGKTPPFSPMFQPICMQICPLHITREGKASKHAQSKLLIFYPFYLVFTWFLPEKHFGPLLRSYRSWHVPS